MLRFRNALIATAALALVGMAAALTPSGRAVAQETRELLVRVVNTPDVNVANSPSVHSVQAGAWNVGVNGTVTVANASNNAVPIVDTGTFSRQAYRARLLCLTTDDSCHDSLTVPIGRLLVIETYSADCGTGTDTSAVRSSIDIPPFGGGLPNTFYFPLVRNVIGPFGPFGGNGRHHNMTAAVRLYADPGTEIIFRFLRSPSGNTTFLQCEAAVSGVLVDCGPGSCPIS
jgi:hypothetical protein